MFRRQAAFALLMLAMLLGAPQVLRAQTFPALTGRVVDVANVIPADEKARLEQKLAALETQSKRQLVVATVPDLEGYDINDYANRLYRQWKLGDKTRNDGALFLVAPKDRKLRIETGYGLEGIVTDGLSFLIIQQAVVPKFKEGDMPGGIEAGADALIKQLTLSDDQARQIAAQAAVAPQRRSSSGGIPIIPIIVIFFFVVLPMLRRMRGGRAYRGGSGLGPILVWDALNSMSRGGGGFGGGGFGGGGGGGFSGGGGSSGGGGASGSW